MAEQNESVQENSTEVVQCIDLATTTESLPEGEPLELAQPGNTLAHGCTGSCHQLHSENRQLRNKVKSLRKQLTAKRDAIKSCQKSRLRLGK